MTAAVRSAGSSRRTGAGERAGRRAATRFLTFLALVLTGLCAAAPASAQLGATFSLESDYRWRGYSMSDGRPAATAQLNSDDASGFYLNLSGSSQLAPDGPHFLAFQANAGFARQLGPSVTIDAGIVRSDFRRLYRRGPQRHYSEAYAGLSYKRVTGRLYYSPDYYGDAATLYGEIESYVEPLANWRVNAHAGALHYLTLPRYLSSRSLRYDWRIGLARQLGPIELHTALSGGGPGQDYYRGRNRGRTALTVGASWSF